MHLGLYNLISRPGRNKQTVTMSPLLLSNRWIYTEIKKLFTFSLHLRRSQLSQYRSCLSLALAYSTGGSMKRPHSGSYL